MGSMCAKIVPAEVQKGTLEEPTIAKSIGATKLIPTLVRRTYAVPIAIFPPSNPITTGEAEAAGQIKQLKAPWATLSGSTLRKRKNEAIESKS